MTSVLRTGLLSALLGLGLLSACIGSRPAQPPPFADQTLAGIVTHDLHRAYRNLPFDVPEGVTRISLAIDYDGGNSWTAIDMAVFDPERFRGASGFGKTRIDIGVFDATPSFLPGPLPSGRWNLVLGGANAPEGRETPFRVTVHFDREGGSRPTGFATAPLNDKPGWYRGDFHAHTGHSDGRCLSAAGIQVPCPVFRTLQAAADAGLDFIAVTDHNTTSHFESLRELQPYFDKLAIIPAQEVTTYQGHMNVFGVMAPVDFRLGATPDHTFSAIANRVGDLHGVLSINHPGISLTEGCPGCGWSGETSTYDGLGAVEVMNGVTARYSGAEGPQSSLPFWRDLLNRGYRVTAIGGSDNHDPTEKAGALSAIGGPATVVHADTLSATGILDGVRRGHVFIDVDGTRDRLLTLSAATPDAAVQMGDALPASKGALIRFSVHVAAAPGARIEVLRDGVLLDIADLHAPLSADDERSFSLASDGQPHWVSANVRDGSGRLLLIGNPIYLHRP